MLPITPENFAAVLIAAGTGASAVLSAIGGWALWKKKSDPLPPGSPDALLVSLAKLTNAMDGMGGQFGDNLKMFAATLRLVEGMADDAEKTRIAAEAAREHLGAIRDATNRSRR